MANIAFERFADEGDVVGRTERELLPPFEQFLHDASAEGVSFPVTMASGPNAAKPHTELSDRRIEAGETLLVDGPRRATPLQRPHAGLSPPEASRRAETRGTQVCLDAQLTALEAVRPGASGPGAEPRRAGPDHRGGYGESFGHGLGHGIGLESTRIRPSRGIRTRPRSRQCVDRRAGIYLPGWAGSGSRTSSSSAWPPGNADRRSRRSWKSRLGCRGGDVVKTNQFKNGMHIEVEGRLAHRRVPAREARQGRRVRATKLKNLDSDAVVDKIFRAGEKFNRVHTEVKRRSTSTTRATTSSSWTPARTSSSPCRASRSRTCSTSSSRPDLQVLTVDGKPSGVCFPPLSSSRSPRPSRGQGRHVSNVTKPAKLETGATVQVPLFVNTGDRIKVAPRRPLHLPRLRARYPLRAPALVDTTIRVLSQEPLAGRMPTADCSGSPSCSTAPASRTSRSPAAASSTPPSAAASRARGSEFGRSRRGRRRRSAWRSAADSCRLPPCWRRLRAPFRRERGRERGSTVPARGTAERC